MCGGGLRSGGLRGGGLRGGDLRGGSLRSDENLRSFRQAKILVTARGATFFVHRLGGQGAEWLGGTTFDHQIAGGDIFGN